MNQIPEKLTVRLGDMRTRIGKWCKSNNKTPSEAVRIALAEMLERKPPVMKVGRPIKGKD